MESRSKRIAGATRLLEPYSNVVIGQYPKRMPLEVANEFEVFVNLTSLPNKKDIYSKTYRIPINETEAWDRELSRLKTLLDHHYTKGDSIYLHDKNGINRAPCVAMYWLISRGHKLEESASIISEGDEIFIELNKDTFLGNVKRSYIPIRELDSL